MGLRSIVDWVWRHPAPQSTAALRMATRYPRLLPPNPSPEAYVAWLRSIGEDLTNTDLMEHYADVCEIAGWMIDDDPHRPGGTRAMSEHVPASVPEPAPVPVPVPVPVPSVVARVPDPVPTVPTVAAVAVRPPLEAVEAASRFHAWLIAHRHYGEHSTASIEKLYRQHSEELGHVPCSLKVLKSHFGKIPGVKRGFVDNARVRPDARNRSRSWIVTVTERRSAVPVPENDVPRRRAAS